MIFYADEVMRDDFMLFNVNHFSVLFVDTTIKGLKTASHCIHIEIPC